MSRFYRAVRRFESKSGFATKTEAKNQAKAFELEIKKKVEDGDNIEELIKKDKSKLTLHELLDLWLNSKKLTIKPTTLETYTNYCGMIKTVFKLKSTSSYRTIALFDYTIEALRKHKAAQEGVIPNLKYVCSNADGSPYNPDTLGSNYRRLMKVYNLCDRLGLKYIRFHDLSYPNLNKIHTFFIKS